MLGIHDYGIFVASAILLNLAPGQDTLYILGRSIGQGRRIGVASALGVSAGTLVHTVAAALGLSAIVATSATAFLIVKLVGAAYLVYLGVRAIVWPPSITAATTAAGGADTAKAFRQGLLTNVLNPKVALFFLAFLPQFVEVDAPAKTTAFLVLGLTFVTTGTIWVLILALAAAQVRTLFVRRPRVQAWISRTMGCVFVYLGIRLAVSER
jgi:threonine/homoserine/homoserine lactone efflux protein